MANQPRVIDCMNLAGAFTLGAVQAGFDLTHIAREPDAFGLDNVIRNLNLLGSPSVEVGDAEQWSPVQAEFLSATPPCSGFSGLNTSKGSNFRGSDSPINKCMWWVAKYAARCIGGDGRRGPEVVAFESVQGAGKRGRPLMTSLLNYLRETTGGDYQLHHVFMSGASVGAAQVRRRYFFVAHRVPFGIESPHVERVCTYADSIGDLVGLDITPDEQPYRLPPTWWSERKRRPDGLVADHTYATNKPVIRSIALTEKWEPGESMEAALDRWIHYYGYLPECWEDRGDRVHHMIANPGFNSPIRVPWWKCGYVLTGHGPQAQIHPEEQRPLTIREGARLMGFPDTWSWDAARHPMQAGLWLGKQIPVESGEWISSWVKRAIEGDPGQWFGDRLDDNEWVVDITNDFTAVFNPKTGQHYDARSKRVREDMERRAA